MPILIKLYSNLKEATQQRAITSIEHRLSMEEQIYCDANSGPQVPIELQISTASSYLFDEDHTIHQGALYGLQQEPQIIIKIIEPQSQPNRNSNSFLPFEQQLLNLTSYLQSDIRGEQVFNEFLVKFQVKQQQLNQAIQSILEQQNTLKQPTMSICLFYLTYINYYFMRNHEAMLSQDFNVEQMSMIKTNFSYARHKKIIGINYQTLLDFNYAGKIRLLEILKERRRRQQKGLRHMLGRIGPQLHFAYGSDVPNALKKVGEEMCFGNLEMSYTKIQFNDLLLYFQSFILARKITIKPSLKDYLKIFKCDEGQPR